MTHPLIRKGLAAIGLLLIAFPGALAAEPNPAVAPQPELTASAPPADGAAPAPAAALPRSPAEEKFWAALQRLRRPAPADLAAGRVLLRSSSDLGYSHAQVLLANCYLAGSYGFTKDPKKGAALFRLAADQGNAFAKVSLGQCYLAGNGVRRSESKAVKLLEAALAPTADFSRPIPPAEFLAAAADGNSAAANSTVAGEMEEDPVASAQASAHYLLGLVRRAAHDLVGAQDHFVAAATAGPDGRSGVYNAALFAALNYAFGQGTLRDMPKANAMLDCSRKLRARLGVSVIHNYVQLKVVDDFAVVDLEEQVAKAGTDLQNALQLRIAETFGDPKSPEYSPREAARWYELAADSGQAWAMLELGIFHSRGLIGPRDPVKAFAYFEKAGGGDKPKHLLGAANLAICYQNGIGTEKDPARAAAIFKKFRNDEFVCYLGSIGRCPDDVMTYAEALMHNADWAKSKSDPHAEYLYGLRFLRGWGVESDERTAEKWLKKALDDGDGPACGDLGTIYFERGDFARARACYTKGQARQDARSFTGLGRLAERRTELPPNNDRALDYYRQAVALDPAYLPARQRHAALLLRLLLGDSANPAAGRPAAAPLAPEKIDQPKYNELLEELVAADKLGLAWAAYQRGLLAYDGRLSPKDLDAAYRFFDDAATRGWTDAHFYLGQMHERGETVPVTLTEAAYHYRLAAVEGNVEALRRLARFYIDGRGVVRDLDRAAFWLVRLAKDGDAAGTIELGDVLLEKGDYENARTLFSKLSNNPAPAIRGDACDRLSRIYDQGLGVPKDGKRAQKLRDSALRDGNGPAMHATAMAWLAGGKKRDAIGLLERAAAAKVPAAEFQLASFYREGDGVPRDPERALELLHGAVRDGSAEAEVQLAGMTLTAAPGAPDLDEAIRLADSAASRGNADAAALREKLEQRRRALPAPPPDESTGARSG